MNVSVSTSDVKLRSNPVNVGPVISGKTLRACLASLGVIGLLLVSGTKREVNERKVLLMTVARLRSCLIVLRSSIVKVILTPVKFLSVLSPSVKRREILASILSCSTRSVKLMLFTSTGSENVKINCPESKSN